MGSFLTLFKAVSAFRSTTLNSKLEFQLVDNDVFHIEKGFIYQSHNDVKIAFCGYTKKDLSNGTVLINLPSDIKLPLKWTCNAVAIGQTLDKTCYIAIAANSNMVNIGTFDKTIAKLTWIYGSIAYPI